MTVVAAVPWTYWMAPPLLAAALLLDLYLAITYVRRFVLPRMVRKVWRDQNVVQLPRRQPPLAVEPRTSRPARVA